MLGVDVAAGDLRDATGAVVVVGNGDAKTIRGGGHVPAKVVGVVSVEAAGATVGWSTLSVKNGAPHCIVAVLSPRGVRRVRSAGVGCCKSPNRVGDRSPRGCLVISHGHWSGGPRSSRVAVGFVSETVESVVSICGSDRS